MRFATFALLNMPVNDLPGSERLYEAVNELVRAYQSRDRERVCCHDLNLNQWAALSYVFRGGPVGLNALAEHLALDKSTASRVVDSLVKKGLVERVENSSDRRAIELGTSPAGAALYQTIRASLMVEEDQLLAGLSAEQRAAILGLIVRLTDAARGGRAAASCVAPGAST